MGSPAFGGVLETDGFCLSDCTPLSESEERGRLSVGRYRTMSGGFSFLKVGCLLGEGVRLSTGCFWIGRGERMEEELMSIAGVCITFWWYQPSQFLVFSRVLIFPGRER